MSEREYAEMFRYKCPHLTPGQRRHLVEVALEKEAEQERAKVAARRGRARRKAEGREARARAGRG